MISLAILVENTARSKGVIGEHGLAYWLGFCHCTGFAATARLWNEFPGRCFQAHAGLRMDFGK